MTGPFGLFSHAVRVLCKLGSSVQTTQDIIVSTKVQVCRGSKTKQRVS